MGAGPCSSCSAHWAMHGWAEILVLSLVSASVSVGSLMKCSILTSSSSSLLRGTISHSSQVLQSSFARRNGAHGKNVCRP
jgi:hypothetical protein